MIGIRVDANNEIATGHVMRCLTIALKMKSIGIDCMFISADNNTEKIITSSGFKLICLNTPWNNPEKETERLIEVIKQFSITKLIIDSYYVTEKYLKLLQNYTKLIYIDDMNFFRYPVSMVINYNIYFELFSYAEIYKEINTQLLLGCSYTPLREEFNDSIFSFRKIVKKILITTGGSDKYNITGKIINGIIEKKIFKGIEIHIIIGSYNRNSEYLKNFFNDYNSIVFHKDVKNISKLMMDCDIALTAGGLTMYELCACGIPAISFSFADNQLYGVKEFDKEKLIPYAGDVRKNEEACILKMTNYIQEYLENPEVRRKKAIMMRRKVDGKGTNRIVEAINKL